MPEEDDEQPINNTAIVISHEYRKIAMKYFVLLTLIGVSIYFGQTASKLSCLDETGNNVDWFIIYKIPHLLDNEVLKSGYSYAFLSSNSASSTWRLSRNYITNSSSVLGRTVTNLYSNPSGSSYIFYNDEPPTSSGND